MDAPASWICVVRLPVKIPAPVMLPFRAFAPPVVSAPVKVLPPVVLPANGMAVWRFPARVAVPDEAPAINIWVVSTPVDVEKPVILPFRAFAPPVVSAPVKAAPLAMLPFKGMPVCNAPTIVVSP